MQQEVKTYFFDTYAFHEIIEGNPDYEEFINVAIITTKLNLMELYYGLLIERGQEVAEKYYKILKEYAIEIDDETIKQAMHFRAMNKKRKLSYVDCIGYITAGKRGVKFLTGDKEFESFENVEFIK